MQTIIVTDDQSNWEFLNALAPIVEATDYLSKDIYHQSKSMRVINLCKSYNYQNIGYYVSLLAEARDHKTIPSVLSIQDVLNTCLSKQISHDITEEMQHSLHEIKGNTFVLSLYFGQNIAKRYEILAKKLHSFFPLPLIRFTFEKKKEWVIKTLTPLSFAEIPVQHQEFIHTAANSYFAKKRFHQWRKKTRYHDLAILIDPSEPNAPSNKKALECFVNAGEEAGLNVDLIDKNDAKSIAEYDALFIRATTNINHYTYQVARRAAQENLVVIDDPHSIVKCSNKVYLAELLTSHQILTPDTIFISKYDTQLPPIQFPCILKKPDGSFSHGVIKISDEKLLQKSLQQFFKTSDLVLIQKFIPTEFDWRIGILDNKPLYACKYYMAKDHWQIYNWGSIKDIEGCCSAVALPEVPEAVVKTALKITRLIGDGLYGVDIKSYEDKHYVIEVNDNPNIDAGMEDNVLGSSIYQQIMAVFLQRIRRKHGYV